MDRHDGTRRRWRRAAAADDGPPGAPPRALRTLREWLAVLGGLVALAGAVLRLVVEWRAL